MDLFSSDNPDVTNTDSASLSQYLGYLGDAVKTGATAYQAFNGTGSPTTVNSQVKSGVSGIAATASGTKSWLPWAIGGGIALLAVLFVALRK